MLVSSRRLLAWLATHHWMFCLLLDAHMAFNRKVEIVNFFWKTHRFVCVQSFHAQHNRAYKPHASARKSSKPTRAYWAFLWFKLRLPRITVRQGANARCVILLTRIRLRKRLFIVDHSIRTMQWLHEFLGAHRAVILNFSWLVAPCSSIRFCNITAELFSKGRWSWLLANRSVAPRGAEGLRLRNPVIEAYAGKCGQACSARQHDLGHVEKLEFCLLLSQKLPACHFCNSFSADPDLTSMDFF